MAAKRPSASYLSSYLTAVFILLKFFTQPRMAISWWCLEVLGDWLEVLLTKSGTWVRYGYGSVDKSLSRLVFEKS